MGTGAQRLTVTGCENTDRAKARDTNSESAKAPERLDLMLALGNAAVHAGKYDLAIYTFQRLLDRMDTGSDARADIYLRLGETYRRKGDVGASVQALEKARELSPGNRLVMGPLAVALEAAGRHTEAAQILVEGEFKRATQAALTTNFLKDELAFEEKRLAALRSQPARDAEAIRQAEFQLAETKRRLAASSGPTAAGRVLAEIHVANLPESWKRELHLPVHGGDRLTDVTIGATIAAVKVFDESVDVRFVVMENDKVQVQIGRMRR